ncbi:MAG: hypothetical protein H6631_11485 [Anaerolineaceae bacterium]|nr:hypothetical protein [Anaerolineaceae bacterium]
MPGSIGTAQLLVEGNNDRHVIWALCEQHSVPETFSVEIPKEDNGGVEALLKSIPVRLKISGLRALGIILDADQSLGGRWDAVCERFRQAGYSDLPSTPEPNGSIIEVGQMPRIGIWLMPNNHLPGMLENFVSYLIPDDDLLATKVEDILHQIESEDLNKYSLSHHQKAFIHAWLAWQKTPGQPMGQAITAQVLNHNQPLAQAFTKWLNLLFNS